MYGDLGGVHNFAGDINADGRAELLIVAAAFSTWLGNWATAPPTETPTIGTSPALRQPTS
jgi:hypothetical protein